MLTLPLASHSVNSGLILPISWWGSWYKLLGLTSGIVMRIHGGRLNIVSESFRRNGKA